MSLLVAATMLMGIVTANVTLGASEPAVRFTIYETIYGWTYVINEGGVNLGFATDGGMELLIIDGWAFKDMNGNGVLDDYEDWRLEPNVRAADLAAQLSLDQIANLMFFSGHQGNMDPNLTEAQIDALDRGVRHFLNAASGQPARAQAVWANSMQIYAEQACSLSIPVNISTDPRVNNISRWPQNLALASTFNPYLAFERAVALSMEKRAMGIVTYLGPQIDLATEPRWYRVSGTMSEDPALARDLTRATVDGYQSTWTADGTDLGWGINSMHAMIKHWPGDGPSEGGRGSHQWWGAFNVFPGGEFETHLIPFVDGGLQLDGLTEMATTVMTSYSISWSETEEFGDLVGTAFSYFKNQLLRDYGFDGPIVTDWNVHAAMGHGSEIEHLPAYERMYIMIMVGTDQFGGLGMAPAHTEYLLRAIEILEEREGYEFMRARLEDTARRITRQFFTLGMFDNPFLNIEDSMAIVMNADHVARGLDAQSQSIIMLKNDGVISENWAGERPLVYVPMGLNTPGAHTDGTPHYAFAHRVPLEILEDHFDVITDSVASTLTGVTATAGAAEGTTFASPDDIIRASAEDIADVDFILVFMQGPICANSNWNMGIHHDHWAHGPVPTWDYHKINLNHITYIPIALQYRPYRAVNDYVREMSIAGRSILWSLEELYGPEEFYERENRSYFGQRSMPLNEHELDFLFDIIEIAPEGVPIIVAMNAARGYIFAEFEDYVDAIFLGFGVLNDAFLPLVLGHVEPSALLPIQMPLDMLAVERQYEDVPRDMDVFVDSMGNAYDFAFGLNWSGVISDWRTERYDVPPITQAERQPVHRPAGITR